MSTETTLGSALLFAAVAFCSCSDEGTRQAEEPEASVQEFVLHAAAVAAAIEANPAAADSILAAHQMNRATLDSLMYEIALDEDLTEAFEAARRR